MALWGLNSAGGELRQAAKHESLFAKSWPDGFSLRLKASRVVDRGCEFRRARSRHRGAMATRESAAVRSRIGVQVSIVTVKKSPKLGSEAAIWSWPALQWSNVRRHAECRICTGDMNG